MDVSGMAARLADNARSLRSRLGPEPDPLSAAAYEFAVAKELDWEPNPIFEAYAMAHGLLLSAADNFGFACHPFGYAQARLWGLGGDTIMLGGWGTGVVAA